MLNHLIEWAFIREGTLYLTCNEKRAFFTSDEHKSYYVWSCQKVCVALIYILDNLSIRFGTKLYRQIEGIPMRTICYFYFVMRRISFTTL